MACLIALATRLGVVWKVFATEYFGDVVRVPDGPRRGYQEQSQNKRFFQSSLSLFLLVNAPMLHRACSTIIVNPNIKVKFQTNEHLKKVFSEQFELF